MPARITRLHLPLVRPAFVAPLIALVAFAVLALVSAAQAGLAFCSNRVALAMPEMPGMDQTAAPMHHALLVCPVVLVLIVASAGMAAVALAVMRADPHRSVTRRTLARAIARVPVVSAAGTLATIAAAGVVAMIAVDGHGVPSVALCALLGALLIGGAFAAVVLSSAAAHVALACGERLFIAVVAAVASRAAGEEPVRRAPATRYTFCDTSRLLATGRGLRAPPSLVR